MKIFSIFFLVLLIASCSDNTQNNPYIPPEVTAIISGDINYYYEAQTAVRQEIRKDGGTNLIMGGDVQEGNDLYGMIFTVYFKNEIKTGVFSVKDSVNAGSENAATISFFYNDGKVVSIFNSRSGTLEITGIDGPQIKGSFNFIAKKGDSSEINVTDGILDTAQ